MTADKKYCGSLERQSKDCRVSIAGNLRYHLAQGKQGFITFLTLSFLFIAVASMAQPYVSREGRFQVDQIKGCAPLTINITNANLITSGQCTGAKPCAMNYEGIASVQNLFTYTFTTAGTFKLTVLYQNQVGGPDDITITVLPNIQPTFELYTCSSNKVTLKVTDKTYDQYFIDFGDGSAIVGIPFSNNQVAAHNYAASGNFNISVHGKDLNAADDCNALVKTFQAIAVLPAPTINTLTALDATSLQIDFSAAANLQLHLEIAVNNDATFQLFQNLYGVSTTTVPNLVLDQNYYCFRLSAYDPCTGGNTYSNTVCSQVFTVAAKNNYNALVWVTPTTGVTNYSISRNGAAYITNPIQNFDDSGVLCKTNYCYQVTNNYSNGSKSISQTKCVDALSTTAPTTINNTSAVVDADQVTLNWLTDPAFVPTLYTVLRAQNSGSPQYLDTAATPKYIDHSYSTSGNYCYRIIYKDQCGNTSVPGDLVCPLRLSGTLDKKNVISLEWNDYLGWTTGVKTYVLEKYNAKGSLLKTVTVGTGTTFVDNEFDPINQIVSYRLLAMPNDGTLVTSVSNTVRFVKGVNLFYPTAFTPNGDSLNDGFMVSGQYIARIQVNIFDRWGTLIYSTDNNQPWDGTFNGKLMPETTYVWTAKVTDIAGQNTSQHGTVVLFKKNR